MGDKDAVVRRIEDKVKSLEKRIKVLEEDNHCLKEDNDCLKISVKNLEIDNYLKLKLQMELQQTKGIIRMISFEAKNITSAIIK